MSLFVQLFSLISGTQTHLLLNRIPVNLIDLWFSFHTQDWFFYPSLIWPKCSSNVLFLITPLDQTSRIEITWSNCNCNYKMVHTSWLNLSTKYIDFFIKYCNEKMRILLNAQSDRVYNYFQYKTTCL